MDKTLLNRHRTVLLWTALLAGHVAWSIHLIASYMMVHVVCPGGQALWLHALSAGTLLLCAAGALLGWRLWRAAGLQWPSRGGSREARAQFMAAAGFILSVLFGVVIIVEAIPNFLIHPCVR